MQVVFLGTSCAKPTKERNHSAIFLSYGSDGLLFDCGEGTQRQMIVAGIKPTKVNKIFITHWHGDHVLGLPGLIQTLGVMEYAGVLKIYGPAGTKEKIRLMFQAFEFEQKIEIEIEEIKTEVFYEGKEYKVEAYALEHSIRTLGYRFVEKNRRRINVAAVKKIGIPEGPLLGELQEGKIVKFKGKEVHPKDVTYVVNGKVVAYIPDSVPCENSLKVAEDADLLICDATYASELQEKADSYMHMTAKEAGEIANKANVNKLVITHFSNRYKDAHVLEEDARNVFDNVVAAKDFMKINM